MLVSRTALSFVLAVLLTSTMVQAAKPAPKPQEDFAPYWTVEPGWRTELQMRNNLAHGDLTVVPVLRDHDGAEFPLAPVTISPNEIKSVDVSEAVVKDAPQLAGSYGSVVFRYTSPSYKNLYAAVMVFDSGHPIAFHMDAFADVPDFIAGSREGIWWLPSATVRDYLVLTNKSQRPLATTLRLYDAKGESFAQSLVLKPRAMSRFSVRELLQKARLAGEYGGIQVEAKSGAGSLDTTHIMFDETAGFSALMKMFDRDPNEQVTPLSNPPTEEDKIWTTRAPMLALTNPDAALTFPADTVLQPRIFVRNTTSKTISASLRFNWRSDNKSGSSNLATLAVPAHGTKLVDISALQKNKLIPTEAHWASIELSAPSQPNDLVAVAASYDDSLRHGTQTPFNDTLTYMWEGGHWQADSTHDSIITAGNGGRKTIRARFTLYYDGGRQAYDIEQELKPHEQMWIDVGKLIRDRVAGKGGALLPPGLTMGAYAFRDLTDPTVGNLYEGKVILDKTFGHVAYGCGGCCGMEGAPYMNINPMDLGVSTQRDQQVMDTDTCNHEAKEQAAGSWRTDDSNIATASNGVVTGVGAGQTTHYAKVFLESITVGNTCQRASPGTSGPVAVCPIPTSESTQLQGVLQGYPIVTQFNQTLSDVKSDSFDGYTVKEASGGQGTNSCWWATNSRNIPEYPAVSGGTWTVASGEVSGQHNHWGFDNVGLTIESMAAYIRTYGPANGITLPCTFTIYQEMWFYCDAALSYLYVNDTTTTTINASTTVRNCRAGNCQTINGY